MPDIVPDPADGLHARLSRTKWYEIAERLKKAEVVALIVGVLAVLAHVGTISEPGGVVTDIRRVVLIVICFLFGSRVFRMVTTTSGQVIKRLLNAHLVLPLIWLVGIIVMETRSYGGWTTAETALTSDFAWSEAFLFLMGLVSLLNLFRGLAAKTHNSAILLVGSFLVVIGIGTLLLMMPGCRATSPDVESGGAPWHVALFTATSASCVTGLIVEPTGSYWSTLGHAVIFGLFQIGGLGILTFGAFLSVFSGRQGLQFREANTVRDMLNADTVQDSRRLLFTILSFTIGVEAIGAVLLVGLWPEGGEHNPYWHAVFHSVSAFCNAGFSLHDDGFLNLGTRWQVWGPLTWLIILGGLGFPVVRDLWMRATTLLSRRRLQNSFVDAKPIHRLTLNTRMVLLSSAVLLFGGTLIWFLLESQNTLQTSTSTKRFADAWFQSVTFRTAGFNSVDHGGMTPASKLLAIFLMFIGAAPGSTGGGVKTVVFAITLLNILAVFRGRDRVEFFGRCIPATQVARSLAMITIGLFIVMGTTGLLVIFERQPERFIDHLFEATSAFGTVGVSANVTAGLTLPSRMLICLVMFLGRVGPVTLLLAMASPSEPCRYEYPEERVNLG